MATRHDEFANQSRKIQESKTRQVNSEVTDRSHTSITSKVKPLSGDNKIDLINDLNSREYSMTSTVFNQICETQTSQHSYYLNSINIAALKHTFFKENSDITNPINLSDSFPLDLTYKKALSTPQSCAVALDLTCNEAVEPSARCEPFIQIYKDFVKDLQIHEATNITEDFDSDDSVRDKSYWPDTLSISSSSEEDILAPSTSKRSRKEARTVAWHTNLIGKKVINLACDGPFIKKENVPLKPSNTIDTSRSVQDKNIQSQTLSNVRTKSCDGTPSAEHLVSNCTNTCTITEKISLNKRRNTLDTPRSLQDTNTQTMSRKRSNSWDSFLTNNILTDRERKKYNTTLVETNTIEQRWTREKKRVKPGCQNFCPRRCSTLFDKRSREAVNCLYWQLNRKERHNFIKNHVSAEVTNTKYNKKNTYRLRNNNGIAIIVCKAFFLTTLGFNKNNDKVLYTKSPVDYRGKTAAFDRNLLTEHIESFHPSEPHYRCEYAQLRRYMPRDVTITVMHDDFCKKHPNLNVSYGVYRIHVKKMDISLIRHGQTECELCAGYISHMSLKSHNVLHELVPDCAPCVNWAAHHDKYSKARELYNFHMSQKQSLSQIFYSADLEKVIMVPRLETFNTDILCNRLTVYNQTFAPLDKTTLKPKPLAVLWHDGIAGRKQEDIMSAFYSFLIRYRAIQTINIWLDDSSHNKNWLLFSLLTHMVNSDLISAEYIILYYFEPGHTCMSCDEIHHNVELSMKRSKLYDYNDFVTAVRSTHNGRLDVKSLVPECFLFITNHVSERRTNNSKPRTYLKDMSQVCFRRKQYDLLYKNNFDDEYINLRFMNDQYLKDPSIMTVSFRTEPKGIEESRKVAIINKLSGLIPAHKMYFWTNLPTHE